MKARIRKLLEEQKRLQADLRRSPAPVNFEGKTIKKGLTPYAVELKRKIAKLGKKN